MFIPYNDWDYKYLLKEKITSNMQEFIKDHLYGYVLQILYE